MAKEEVNQAWNHFFRSGRVSDYLRYKEKLSAEIAAETKETNDASQGEGDSLKKS